MSALDDYLASMAVAVEATECELMGESHSVSDGVAYVIDLIKDRQASGGVCWLIGNGGSGTIADHIACDMLLNHDWRALALTNTALITTMSNDFGGQYGFSRPLEKLAREGDVLIGMSCSGESENVIEAMADARLKRVALTGFRSSNTLRRMDADVCFWVPADDYGAVQIAHLALLHAVIDLAGTSA